MGCFTVVGLFAPPVKTPDRLGLLSPSRAAVPNVAHPRDSRVRVSSRAPRIRTAGYLSQATEKPVGALATAVKGVHCLQSVSHWIEAGCCELASPTYPVQDAGGV